MADREDDGGVLGMETVSAQEDVRAQVLPSPSALAVPEADGGVTCIVASFLVDMLNETESGPQRWAVLRCLASLRATSRAWRAGVSLANPVHYLAPKHVEALPLLPSLFPSLPSLSFSRLQSLASVERSYVASRTSNTSVEALSFAHLPGVVSFSRIKSILRFFPSLVSLDLSGVTLVLADGEDEVEDARRDEEEDEAAELAAADADGRGTLPALDLSGAICSPTALCVALSTWPRVAALSVAGCFRLSPDQGGDAADDFNFVDEEAERDEARPGGPSGVLNTFGLNELSFALRGLGRRSSLTELDISGCSWAGELMGWLIAHQLAPLPTQPEQSKTRELRRRRSRRNAGQQMHACSIQ